MRTFLERTFAVTFTAWAEPGEWGDTYAFLRDGRLTIVEGLPMLMAALTSSPSALRPTLLAA